MNLCRSYVMTALMLGGAQIACAEGKHDQGRVEFDIARQPVGQALFQFAGQAGIPLLIPGDRFVRNANRLVGKHSLEEGLKRLLKGTDVEARIDEFGQIVVRDTRRPSRENNENAEGNDMKIESSGSRNILLSALAAFFAGGVADAQEQDVGDPVLQDVVVTGTRIQRSGMDMPTPVTSASISQLKDMAPGPMIEGLTQLPQFFGNTGPKESSWNSAAVSGGLNLRGAGLNRTLVLLDGRRVTSANRVGVVDVSILPEALIRGVETVTGGASATYGSDAVAGVVNFLLNTDFTGFSAQVQGGRTSRHDGDNGQVKLTYGTALGERFHFIVAGDLFHQDGIDSFDSLKSRGFYQQRARVTNPDPNGPTEIIRPYTSPTNLSYSGVINQPGSQLDKLEFEGSGANLTAAPLQFSGVGRLVGGCNCQAEPTQSYGVDRDAFIMREIDHKNLFSHLTFNATDATSLYLQGLYGKSSIDSPWVGLPLSGPWEARIFSGNPYLPAQVQQIMNQEGLASFGLGMVGLNTNNPTLPTYTAEMSNELGAVTLGFDSKLGGSGAWRLKGYAQGGRSTQDIIFRNGIRTDNLFLGLDAVRDPVTGNIACRAALVNPATFGNCVPVDLLGGLQNVSPEAADYIVDPNNKVLHSIVDQKFAELTLDGDIGRGWGAGPVSLAVGASYRKDSFRQNVLPDLRGEFVYINGVNTGYRGLVPENLPDGMLGVRPGSVPNGYLGAANLSSLLWSGSVQNATASTSGAFDVKEAFSELNLPLLSGLPLVSQLDLNLAARWADYSGSGGIWAWKTGLNWHVTTDLRVRGTASRDVRAATLQERFDQAPGGATVRDPLFGGATISTASRSGGNPNLNPEKADTLTVGAIYQPSVLPGFSVSVDWYTIDVADAIGQLSPQNIVDFCQRGAANICALVERDPVTNVITMINGNFINLTDQRIRGTDLEVLYRANLGAGRGSVVWRLLATQMAENSITTPGAPRDDRAGQISMGLPKYKFTTNATYSIGPFRAFLQGRWIDGGILDRFAVEGVTIDNNHVSPVFYTDMRLSYTGATFHSGEWELFGSVTNLFDRDPPPTPGTVGRSGTTEFTTAVHDTLGRRYVIGASMKF
ncbi:MAG: TonB-dependent receptor [Gammaproteobacteria bacterium]